jgi:hypothetical protein
MARIGQASYSQLHPAEADSGEESLWLLPEEQKERMRIATTRFRNEGVSGRRYLTPGG